AAGTKGRIIPQPGVADVVVLRFHVDRSVVVIPATVAVISRLDEFLGKHHGVGGAVRDTGEGVSGRHGTKDTVSGNTGELVDPSGAVVAGVRRGPRLALQPGVERGIVKAGRSSS